MVRFVRLVCIKRPRVAAHMAEQFGAPVAGVVFLVVPLVQGQKPLQLRLDLQAVAVDWEVIVVLSHVRGRREATLLRATSTGEGTDETPHYLAEWVLDLLANRVDA